MSLGKGVDTGLIRYHPLPHSSAFYMGGPAEVLRLMNPHNGKASPIVVLRDPFKDGGHRVATAVQKYAGRTPNALVQFQQRMQGMMGGGGMGGGQMNPRDVAGRVRQALAGGGRGSTSLHEMAETVRNGGGNQVPIPLAGSFAGSAGNMTPNFIPRDLSEIGDEVMEMAGSAVADETLSPTRSAYERSQAVSAVSRVVA